MDEEEQLRRKEELNRLFKGLGDDEKLQEFIRTKILPAHPDEVKQQAETIKKIVAMGLPSVLQSPEAPAPPPVAEARTMTSLRPPADLHLLPVPPFFVDREIEREQLVSCLNVRPPENATTLVTITGMGGIGKTALAGMVVRDLLQSGRYQDGIVVVPGAISRDASGASAARNLVRDILERFEDLRRRHDRSTSGSRGDVTDRRELRQVAQRLLRGKDALVVIDDVEPGLELDEALVLLRELGLTILVTARQTLSLPSSMMDLPTGDRVMRLSLEKLTQRHAFELFTHEYQRGGAKTVTRDDYAAVERIVGALDCHTLAIAVMAAEAAHNPGRLEDFATQLEESPDRTIAGVPGENEGTLRFAFARALRNLPKGQQTFMAGLSAFATAEFSMRAALSVGETLNITAVQSYLDQLESLRLLSSADRTPTSSLSAHYDTRRIYMHPVVRAFAAAQFAHWPEDAQERVKHGITEYFQQYLMELNPPGQERNPDRAAVWDIIDGDKLNIEGALQWANDARQDNEVLTICERMFAFWYDRWLTESALTYLKMGIEAAERLLGATPSGDMAHGGLRKRLADLQLVYAQVLRRAGRRDEVLQRLNANLQQRQATNDREGEAAVLYQLGVVYRVRGDLPAATNALNACLELLRHITNHDERVVGDAYSQLGQIERLKGNLDEAETLLTTSLSIRRAEDVKDRRGEAADLGYLGKIAHDRGKLDLAESLYNESQAIHDSLKNPWAQAEALQQRGRLAQTRGQLEAAQQVFDQLLKRRVEAGDVRGEGYALTYLGQVVQARGQLEEAFTFLTRALDIHTDLVNIRGQAVTLGYMGRIALARGWLDDARRNFRKSLQLAGEAGDRRGAGVVGSQLGQLALVMGDLDEAQRQFEHSLEMRRAVGDQRGEAADLGLLGRVALERGEYDRARQQLRECLTLADKAQDRRGVGIAELYLGRVEEAAGNRPLASEHANRAIEILREVGDRLNESEARLLQADLNAANGELDAAEREYRESLQIAEDLRAGLAIAQGKLKLSTFLFRYRNKFDDGARDLAVDAQRRFTEYGLASQASAAARMLG